MPVQTLLPNATHAPAFTGMAVFGAATAHEALADANDATYLLLQISNAEPTKWFTGEFPSLPDGAGVVNSVTFHVRGYREGGLPPIFQAQFHVGENLTARITDTFPEDPPPLDFASAAITSITDVGYVNAMQWMAGVNKLGGDNQNCRIHRLYADVDFNYINGVTVAMIFQIVGPLIAVGLRELPALRAELWRRSGLLLHAHELRAVWRDLREHRRPRHFLLAVD